MRTRAYGSMSHKRPRSARVFRMRNTILSFNTLQWKIIGVTMYFVCVCLYGVSLPFFRYFETFGGKIRRGDYN